MDSSRIAIRFDVPAGWKISSGYAATPGDARTFTSENLSDLWNNGTMVGRLTERIVHAGQLDVSIAGPAEHGAGVTLVAGALAPVVAAYDSLMGGAPHGKLALLIGVAPLTEGGETFAHSISISLHAEPGMATKGKWAYLLTHELLHLWNGGAIRSAEPAQTAWFLEGFTDYMAKIVAFKTGLSTRDELLAQLARSFDRYDAVTGTTSMRQGGAAKSANYALLYFGGTAVALAVDVDARDRSGLTRGLPDVMRNMYARFAPADSTYTYDDIVRACSAAVGSDMSPFFARYVAGGEKIPVNDYLARLGIARVRHDTATTLQIVPTSSPETVRLRASILGQ